MAKKTINQIINEHNDRLDAIVEEFSGRLQIMVEESTRRLEEELKRRLEIATNGKIASTAQNRGVLLNANRMFRSYLEQAGYSGLLQSYTNSFDGQFVEFKTVFDFINDNLKTPLKAVNFGSADLAEFQSAKVTAQTMLSDVVDQVAATARRQALLSVGALTKDELAEELRKRFGTSVGHSESMADTTISSFYRSITDRGFQIIEEDNPKFKIRYTYEGPLDKFNRPFCLKISRQARQGKSWTRKQIQAMDNKQIPNVFVTGGGYRCRHQWIIAVKDLRDQQEGGQGATDAPAPKAKPTRKEIQREINARKLTNKLPQIKVEMNVKEQMEILTKDIQARREALRGGN